MEVDASGGEQGESKSMWLPYMPNVRIASADDRVFKDECVYTFDTPESPDGLFICLKTFLGVGRNVLEKHASMYGQNVYLRHRRTRHVKEQQNQTATSTTKTDDGESMPKRLAIGVPDGFNPDGPEYEFDDRYSLLLLPQYNEIDWQPPDKLPDLLITAVEAIQKAQSANRIAEAAAQNATWDGEFRVISQYYDDLVQLDNGITVPPSGWVCQREGCGLEKGI